MTRMQVFLLTVLCNCCGIAMIWAGASLIHAANGVQFGIALGEFFRVFGFSLFMAPTTVAVVRSWDLSSESAARRSIANVGMLLALMAGAFFVLGVVH